MAALSSGCKGSSSMKRLLDNEHDGFEDISSSGSFSDPSWQPQNVSTENDSEQEQSPVKRLQETSPEKLPKTRKRRKNLDSWERSKRKRRRNLGRTYVSDKTRAIVEAKAVGPACKCSKKCFERLEPWTDDIFHTFWDMGSFDNQNTYLFCHMKLHTKKRSYPKKTKNQVSRRGHSFTYEVSAGGKLIDICKEAFASVHGLHKNMGRMRNVQKQRINGSTTPEPDKRGYHKNHKKTPDAERNGVHTFLESIPKYTSHYSRQSNPHKVYLDADLTVSSLYEEYYLDFCKQGSIPPISKTLFRTIFNSDFNIGFKMPKSDTCATCDKLETQISDDKQNNETENVKKLEQERELHLRRAQAGQDKIRALTELARSNPDKYHTITIDLQQTLPTPKIPTGPAFYKRKLWTYNLGIHDCGGNKGYMFIWSEGDAKRGADEVGSCILKYLETQPVQAEILCIITDNCKGQGKNWDIIALERALVVCGKFKEIQHWYPVVGHSMLPCDRDFGRIEKHVKKYHSRVYSPNEWVQVIKDAG